MTAPEAHVARVACRGMLLLAALAFDAGASPRPAAEGPSTVRVVETDGSYRLRVNGEPFYVKGAGLEHGDQEALAASGGNSFRTWTPSGGRRMLDRAQRNGLFVALGLEMARERHGFDYNDAAAVARQQARIRSEVLRYKDHPALLMWVVGNELNLEATNPNVWNAVDAIARMIHDIDPHHPVMTTLAGVDPEVVAQVRTRAASLDLIGLQVYGEIDQLPAKIKASGWTGPYIVTEWGPTGHWESPLTEWGAPVEDDSSTKAQLRTDRYRRFIEADTRQCLGSYVFLWGSKQERTPTWYGLFLPSGEATASVDAMHRLWRGHWPDNRSPATGALRIEGRGARDSITLQPGRRYGAAVEASDPDGDAMVYRWTVREESRATTSGGDPEAVPREVAAYVDNERSGSMRFKAPAKPGAYRLFVEIFDGKGSAAYANAPFKVQASNAR